MRARVSLAALALTLALGGCAKQDDDKAAPEPRPDLSISVEEAARGITACKSWVEKACACAETDPAHAAACTEARAIPQAFQMSVRTANAESVEGEVRGRLQREARRIAARCFEELARVACPAPAPTAE